MKSIAVLGLSGLLVVAGCARLGGPAPVPLHDIATETSFKPSQGVGEVEEKETIETGFSFKGVVSERQKPYEKRLQRHYDWHDTRRSVEERVKQIEELEKQRISAVEQGDKSAQEDLAKKIEYETLGLEIISVLFTTFPPREVDYQIYLRDLRKALESPLKFHAYGLRVPRTIGWETVAEKREAFRMDVEDVQGSYKWNFISRRQRDKIFTELERIYDMYVDEVLR